jgi:uroporphyrinogen-III decarboxylase
MTSRERLLAAIARKKTDRVPISTYELVGYNSRSFENNTPSYKNLMDFIREKTDCVCMWGQSSDNRIAHSAYPAQIDRKSIRGANYTQWRLTLHTPKGELTSSHRIYDNLNTVWQTERWCKTPEDADKFLSVPFIPAAYDASDYARIKSEVGDKGIIMSCAADPAYLAMELMEFGESTVWAMTETEHFAKTVEEMRRRNIINLENMLKSRVVDLYRICGPEYLTPPYLPPSYFKRFVTPYLKEMTELIHKYGGLVRIHSHGKIGKVIDEILSCGADALDPCEGPPDGDITLRELKKRAGGRMCLFGNIQLKALEHGDPGEIREIVRSCMNDAKENGGFVIMPTAAPINIPLSPKTEENYRVFIETALELGEYI